GADQMARLISGVAEKHKLSPQPIIAINKSGGAGAEGFLYVKEKKGDPHTIIITLSNLFTTPLAQGTPFNWRDLTPVARMALDRFILWVNAETPYKTAKDYVAAVKERSAGEDRMKMGGTGSKQEDQILRGVFGPPGMPKDAVEWYAAFLKKVYETPEFRKYLEDGALKPAFATGDEYAKWVEENEKLHKDLMAKGGLLPK